MSKGTKSPVEGASTVKRPKRKHKMFFIIIFLALLICAFIAGRITLKDSQEDKFSSSMIENKIIELNELATLDYNYTTVEKFENSKELFDLKIPFTEKSFIVSYDGHIIMGIDLNEAKVDVTDKKVTINLPKAKIISHEIDEDSFEIFDEKSSIFNQLKVKDVNKFQKVHKEETEKKAIDKGLLDEAYKRAAKTVESMVSTIVPEDYQIDIL